MYHNRIIPCLLLRDHGLIKTIKYKGGRYLGDPINAIKIYNDCEVDELIILDIDATKEHRSPDFEYLKKLTQQCFMPVCYGGGITSVDTVKRLFELGIEKVSVNTSLYDNPNMVKECVALFGSQSIVASVDLKRDKSGNVSAWIKNGTELIKEDAFEYMKHIEEDGVGEVFINFIDHDGMMDGYDYEVISRISKHISVPLIVCGGASSTNDCKKAIDVGASAAAAGSIFVFWGRNKAVLINYPDKEEIEKLFL